MGKEACPFVFLSVALKPIKVLACKCSCSHKTINHLLSAGKIGCLFQVKNGKGTEHILGDLPRNSHLRKHLGFSHLWGKTNERCVLCSPWNSGETQTNQQTKST